MKTLLTTFGLLATVLTLQAQEKTTYVDHVRPLLENKCFSCHNPDKKKGDLDLTSFAGAMTGGGSGAIMNPGDPEASKLITCVTKKAEPYMPPEGSPLGQKEIEILTKWIQGGVLETASSIAKKSAPRTNLTLTVSTKGKPAGPPAVPEHVLLEPTVTAPRTTAITALAGSPWAPLVAVSGLRQALIYDTTTKTLAGVYPYPEGYIRSLKFSQNGSLLIAGGGRGGKMGNAVVWDVKTGKRVTEVGKEFDQVMSADISANHSMIAIGSPSKKVKVYNASTGEEMYVIKKHTEWILSVAFSPDGVLLASSDRNGNVIITEAATGGEFYTLDGHKAACHSLSWRADGNLLASCSEDGKIALWEMENGKLVKNWDAHAGGCLSVNFTQDGQLVSAGRDGLVRVWDVTGKKLSESKPMGDLVTKVASISDSKLIASGDWQGNVKLWTADKFEERGALSSNPSPIAKRIVEIEHRAAELVALLPADDAEVKKAEEGVKAAEDKVAAAKKGAADAAAYKQKLEQEIAETPGKVDALQKAIAKANADKAAAQAALVKYNAALEKVKQLDATIAKLTAERGTLNAPDKAPQAAEVDKKIGENKTQLEAVKHDTATAPVPVATFDKLIADSNAQIAALNTAKPAKTKELEATKKALEAWPKNIAAAEAEVPKSKEPVTAAQAKLAEHKAELAFAQKSPTLLKAAQFNVGVLGEKEKLAKLEADVVGYKEAAKDAEAAKVAAAARIEASKKSIAEATAALPGKTAALAKVQGELPAVEKILDPTKAEEGKLAGQLDEQQKALAGKEAELAAATKEKVDRTAAAQKAVTDINAQIAAMLKQLDGVKAKATAPIAAAAAKKAELAKAEGELNALKEKAAAAQKDLDAKTGDFKAKEAALAQAKQQLEAAQKAVPPAPQQQQAAFDAAQKAFAAAQQAQATAKNLVGPATTAAQAKQSAFAALKVQSEVAEKAAAPLRGQLDSLVNQVNAQKKTLAEKQAEPGNADKDFAAKSAPMNGAIGQIKAAIAPLEKQLADVRTKLAADTKIVEGKRADVGKAMAEAEATRKAQTDGQKTIENSTKEIADKTKSVADIKGELAKLEPTLQPTRDRVKQLTEQYFAMLPKAQ